MTQHVHNHGSKKIKETLPSIFPQPSVHWMPHQSTKILGDQYAKKSPLPRIGTTSRLSVFPSIPSHQILGQSCLHNRLSLLHTSTRRAPLESSTHNSRECLKQQFVYQVLMTQIRAHQWRAGGDHTPELSPQTVLWQFMTHPSSFHPQYALCNRVSRQS